LGELATRLALRGCDSGTSRMGTSTRDRFLIPSFDTIVLLLKCLMPPIPFFQTIMFLAESELITGKKLGPGLWIVRGSSSRESLLSIWSRSLSNILTGDEFREFRGVGLTH